MLGSDAEMLLARLSETPLSPPFGSDLREMLRATRVQRSLENVAGVDASEIRLQVLAVNSFARLRRHRRGAYIGRRAEGSLGGKCCYGCPCLGW